MKPDLSMECLFACVFHNNRFQSILCKCFHVEESTAENMRIGVKEVINEFNLSENCFITTDGGTNMVAAFKENRSREISRASLVITRTLRWMLT